MITEETIRDMYLTDLTDIRAQMAKLGQQLVRTQRAVRLDEHDFSLATLQSQRDTNRQLNALTQNVGALVEQKSLDPLQAMQVESEGLYIRNKRERMLEVEKNIRRIRYLSKLRLQKTPVCPCGKHKGIQFYDSKNEPINGVMCPLNWWIKLSRLAFAENRVNQFLESTPLEKYLKGFSQ